MAGRPRLQASRPIRQPLEKYAFPPDHQTMAIELILRQPELLAGRGPGSS